MIDYESPEAPYLQVAAILRQRIADGTYTRRLPSTRDLTQEFGIADVTGRKALAVLVDAGEAVRSPGRGTYVAKPGGE